MQGTDRTECGQFKGIDTNVRVAPRTGVRVKVMTGIQVKIERVTVVLASHGLYTGICESHRSWSKTAPCDFGTLARNGDSPGVFQTEGWG
jgi:hypothetical protein